LLWAAAENQTNLSLPVSLHSPVTMAAASMVRQTACNQSKPSLALKTQHASPLNLFSIPSSNFLYSSLSLSLCLAF